MTSNPSDPKSNASVLVCPECGISIVSGDEKVIVVRRAGITIFHLACRYVDLP